MTIAIDYTLLDEETLNKLIIEFVLREGTDYGAQEASLDKKVDDVLKQLAKNKIQILYDSDSNQCDIVST